MQNLSVYPVRSGSRLHRAVPVWVFAMFLSLSSGCAQLEFLTGSSDHQRARQERLVADDFAAMLKQLTGTRTDDGALTMLEPANAFGNAMLVALRSAGYRVRFSGDLSTPGFVTYNIESLENQYGTSVGYRVKAGQTQLSRDYKMTPKGVFPISFMRVEGVASDNALLDDSRFQRQSVDEALITGITPDPNLNLSIGRSLAGRAAQTDAVGAGGDSARLDARRFDKYAVPKTNMYETRRSSYADVFDHYESINKEVVVFPNDSLRVLPETRDTLARLRAEFNPDSDVFSVIGCSHGKTAIDNGNQLLALGRSKRVLEELIGLGVPDRLVLDEGCWAGVHFDEAMPRRGVVVDLRRRKPAS